MEKPIYWATAILLFTIPLEAISITEGVDISYGRYAYLLLLSLVLLRPTYLLPSKKSYTILLMLFTAYCTISILWSRYPEATLGGVAKLYQGLSILLIVDKVVQERLQFLKVIVAFLLGSTVTALLSINEFVGGASSAFGQDRIYRTEVAGNPNENAFLFVFSVALALVLRHVYRNNRVIRVSLPLFLSLMIVAVFATGSRTGIIMLAVAGVFTTLNAIRGLALRSVSLAFAVVAVSLIGFVTFFPKSNVERVVGIPSDIQSSSLSNRELIWERSLQMMLAADHNPVWGSGWDTFPAHYERLFSTPYGTHNFYLNVLFTTGIIGSAIIAMVLYSLARKIWSVGKKNIPLFGLLLVIPMISMMASNWEHKKWLFLLGFMISGTVDIQRDQRGSTLSVKSSPNARSRGRSGRPSEGLPDITNEVLTHTRTVSGAKTPTSLP